MRAAMSIFGFVWLFCYSPTCADDVAPLREFEKAVKTAVARSDSAIACILVSRQANPISEHELSSPEHVPEYFGSGIVIDDRLVLTCYHVVRDATTIVVKLPPIKNNRGLDGLPRQCSAKVWAGDVRSDLAVLRLDGKFDTPPIEIGRGEELVKGSMVVGISHPFAAGFRDGSPTASWGIVSNIRRRLPGDPREEERHRSLHYYGSLVQTDARMQLGCSGSALVDLDGKLVGIATSQAAMVGAETEGGFVIPLVAGIRRVIDVLRRGEEVEYGFLGVATDASFFGRRSERVYLNRVTPNSPADRGGLRSGEQILKIDGQPIRDYDDMYLHIGLGLAGREIVVQTLRNGRPHNTKVRLAKFHIPNFGKATNVPEPVHGLTVDYTSVISRANIDPMPNGVVVREVVKDSPADEKKLAEHADIITSVNGVAVQTPKEFYAEAEKATRNNQPVRLTLTNPQRTITLP